MATLKGSYCLGESLGVPSICFRFVPSSHTLLLVANSTNLRFFGVIRSYALRIASWVAEHASVIRCNQSVILGSVGVRVG